MARHGTRRHAGALTTAGGLPDLSNLLAPASGPRFETNGLPDGELLASAGIFLRPGDWFFGEGAQRVSTVLGSCVSLVAWAPRWRLGAMCHCLLPRRADSLPRRAPDAALDGRYGDEAAEWMRQRFAKAGVPSEAVEVTLAGGACVNATSVGLSNVAWAQQWLQQQGWRVVQQDVGGRVVRRLVFQVADGSVRIAHGGLLMAAGG